MKIERLAKKWRKLSRQFAEGAIKERGTDSLGSLLAQHADGMSVALRCCAEDIEKALRNELNTERNPPKRVRRASLGVG